MSVAHLIGWRDTRGMLTSASGYAVLAGFLALTGWTFTELLRRNEGGFAPAQAVWAMSVAMWLPLLAALTTMRVLAEERQTGTFETLMTAPITARDMILGKFTAAMTIPVLGILLSVFSVLLLIKMVPHMRGAVSTAGLILALGVLFLQASAWTAVGLLAALLARQQAVSGLLTMVLIGVPYGACAGWIAWVPHARVSLWHWPPLGDAADAATGFFALAPPILYASIAGCVLFVCIRLVEARNIRTR